MLAYSIAGQRKMTMARNCTKSVDDHVELVGRDPGNTALTPTRSAASLPPALSPSDSPGPHHPLLYGQTNRFPSCLTLNLLPPHPLTRITSNSSSIMPWTNTRNVLKTTYLCIRSPHNSNLAILPVRFSHSFSSKSRALIIPEVVMKGGHDGWIRR